ncbi:AmmeMemoRadiSam system protein B [Trichlorobacter sp.]|jgi:AmmeMemoRadiSam system protein B|uniref:AmmeMemoRadiSam system protein B n=1 Tax=Trichlorobacter sp. TaxID=2911007 RepID=UPI002A36F2B8|nr:AmmeMemoRadiSam system protein B [Trichlorobacter sp.]MDY0384354.1 AmmeMemoRadiSam system protein B [Trichlorobacter sp.]
MIRKPAVAGQFYPGNADDLRNVLHQLVPECTDKRSVIGVISPHAGYQYSGSTAGRLLAGIEIPRTVVLLGPNHRGTGALAALAPEDGWQTPLGVVPLEKRLSGLIQRLIPAVQSDAAAHALEHSLEVQVPLLQHLRPDVSIVPLCLSFGDTVGCELLGKGLAAAIRGFGEPVLILASSDMTHYESAETAKQKDMQALKKVLALDAEGLLEVCRLRHITMCGVVPAAVMLVAARELGATQAELVAYTTSGEVTGDLSEVVAYAAVSVW